MKPAVKPIYYILLIAGAALRLIPYCINRSLWLDEAALALNITNKSFAELLHPLDYNQVAPILFLFIEKVNILLLGNSEFSLRLLPLLCGLLSLPLMYRFTKLLTGNTSAALTALYIIATSPVLINYSCEVKQYQCDFFATLCLLNIVFDTGLTANKKYVLLAIAGVVLIFMSNITVLVLFTIGVYYLLKYGLVAILKNRLLIVAFAACVLAFAVNYYCFLYHQPSRAYLEVYWQDAFMPQHIFTRHFLVWVYYKFVSVFNFYALPFLFIYLIAIPVFIWRKQRVYLFLLLFPVCLHAVLSAFKLYPFDTRLILYLTAFITPLIALALITIVQLLSDRLNKYLAWLVFAAVLAFMPAVINNSHYPFYKEEIKKSIDFIVLNRAAGQKIFVYPGANLPAQYYERIGYIPFTKDIVWGTANPWYPQNCLDEIMKMQGKYWLLFSHISTEDISAASTPGNAGTVYHGQEDFIIKHLIVMHGMVLKSFKTTGSSAYLISFSN